MKILLTIGIAMLMGCGYRADMNLKLANVAPSGIIETARPERTIISTYTDGKISAQWSAYFNRLYLRIDNKYDGSIKLIWEDALYVDIDGASAKLIHSGMAYADCESPRTNSNIAKGSFIDEIITPCNKIYYNSRSGFNARPLFYGPQSAFANKHISIILPVEIAGERIPYRFDFIIERQAE
jgi:hypothetical protein